MRSLVWYNCSDCACTSCYKELECAVRSISEVPRVNFVTTFQCKPATGDESTECYSSFVLGELSVRTPVRTGCSS